MDRFSKSILLRVPVLVPPGAADVANGVLVFVPDSVSICVYDLMTKQLKQTYALQKSIRRIFLCGTSELRAH